VEILIASDTYLGVGVEVVEGDVTNHFMACLFLHFKSVFDKI
jgi:hypothetical protein